MAQSSFISRNEGERIDWIVNFVNKAPNYQVKYNLTDAQMKDVKDGAVSARTWYDYRNALEKHLRQVIAFNSEQMNGVAAGGTASQMPVPPFLPTLAMPTPGFFSRAVAIGKSIKMQSVYTEADGKDLGLIGTEITLDVHTMKPVINLRLIGGGHPEIVWKKLGMDGVEIYKDGGDGNFTLLAYDSYPNYTDGAALPSAGQSAVWKYKAIYKYRDEQAGLWSDVVSITVSGN